MWNILNMTKSGIEVNFLPTWWAYSSSLCGKTLLVDPFLWAGHKFNFYSSKLFLPHQFKLACKEPPFADWWITIFAFWSPPWLERDTKFACRMVWGTSLERIAPTMSIQHLYPSHHFHAQSSLPYLWSETACLIWFAKQFIEIIQRTRQHLRQLIQNECIVFISKRSLLKVGWM